MSSTQNFLICIVGPTCTGKTDISIRLARLLDAEILSADSRQFYREMNIGTAKPTRQQLQTVPHHFINFLSIHDSYTAGHYEQDALKILSEIFKKKTIAVLTGGSGLYVKAVCSGFPPLPDADENIRQELNRLKESGGAESWLEMLKNLDIDYYNHVDKNNSRRILRALEVCLLTGKKFSEVRTVKPHPRTFNCFAVGLHLDRKELFDKISQRVDSMIAGGLIEEAQKLFPYRSQIPLQTVGYRELFELMEGKCSKEEAVEKIKINTLKYAKRQLTWFKKDKTIKWFHSCDYESILSYVQSCLSL